MKLVLGSIYNYFYGKTISGTIKNTNLNEIKEYFNGNISNEEVSLIISVGILNSNKFLMYLFLLLICGDSKQINEQSLKKLQLFVNNRIINLEKEQSLLSLGIKDNFDFSIKLKKFE